VPDTPSRQDRQTIRGAKLLRKEALRACRKYKKRLRPDDLAEIRQLCATLDEAVSAGTIRDLGDAS
jgi:hypothetical protein